MPSELFSKEQILELLMLSNTEFEKQCPYALIRKIIEKPRLFQKIYGSDLFHHMVIKIYLLEKGRLPD